MAHSITAVSDRFCILPITSNANLIFGSIRIPTETVVLVSPFLFDVLVAIWASTYLIGLIGRKLALPAN